MRIYELIELLQKLPEEEQEKEAVDDCEAEIVNVRIGWNNQVVLDGWHSSMEDGVVFKPHVQK